MNIFERRTNPVIILPQRPSRKIANTPLKLGKNQIKKTKKPVEKLVKKHEEKLAEKDDNLAVESNVVVTKVKPGKSVATPKKSEPSKPKVEKKAAADRAAYGAPAPKFIIKQAGEGDSNKKVKLFKQVLSSSLISFHRASIIFVFLFSLFSACSVFATRIFGFHETNDDGWAL